MDKPEQPKRDKTNSSSYPGGNLDEVYSFAQKNPWDTVALAILIIGIIAFLFRAYWGGFLIGLIGGLYFADGIVSWCSNIKSNITSEGIVRSLILGGLFLGLFISAPLLFIGGAMGVGVKQVINARKD